MCLEKMLLGTTAGLILAFLMPAVAIVFNITVSKNFKDKYDKFLDKYVVFALIMLGVFLVGVLIEIILEW